MITTRSNLPSFSGLSSSSFNTFAALRVILQFISFISYIVIAGSNNFQYF
ncbi:hypothetical protein EIH79_17260 [Paenibacillus tundrae]|nr:hypothetical protein [Paenibacillus tundrae]